MMPQFRILDTVFVPQVSYQSEIKFESHLNMGWSNKKKSFENTWSKYFAFFAEASSV